MWLSTAMARHPVRLKRRTGVERDFQAERIECLEMLSRLRERACSTIEVSLTSLDFRFGPKVGEEILERFEGHGERNRRTRRFGREHTVIEQAGQNPAAGSLS